MSDTIPVPRVELERIKDVMIRLLPTSGRVLKVKRQTLAAINRLLGTETETGNV